MNKPFLIVILSAFFYGLSIPLSKIALNLGANPLILGGLIYFGAGLGFFIQGISNKLILKKPLFENPLTKKELPYTILMIILDTLAIFLLMIGLSKTNSANASLLSNFEIVATSLIALIVFKEEISKKLRLGIFLIIIASIILTFEGEGSFDFSLGSILVLGSYICWGAENNCTKILSRKNPSEIAMIKGLFSGGINIIIGILKGSVFPQIELLVFILFFGFISYGLSVSLYILGQRFLGASKTSAYFSCAPFFGVILSLLFLRETPQLSFYAAFFIMLVSVILIRFDSKI